MSACGKNSEQILCALTGSRMDFFPPPFFSPFYQGMLAVWGAAGIRAYRNPIYQSRMCPPPVGGLSMLVFSFLFFLLSQIPIPHSFLFCTVSPSFPLPLFEMVLKSNAEQAERRQLGELTLFSPVVSLLSYPITGEHFISKNKKLSPHPWLLNKQYSIVLNHL